MKTMRLHAQRGFTLIELLAAVTIIGMLSVIGIPHFRAYMLEARLNDAQPLLVELAGKMRMRMIERGEYCCDGDIANENIISDETGADLTEAGDFCFMIVCRDAALCPTVSTADFIAPAEADDAPPQFEIWAVLREKSSGNVTSPSGFCQPASAKRPPTGWVRDSSSGEAGRQGQVVVLRYPPPANGIDAAAGADGHRFVWNAGLSKTHALQP